MTELIEHFVAFMNGTPNLPLSMFLFAVTAPAVALLHEYGHALAAVLRVGDASIEVNLLPDPRRPQGICRYDASRATRLDTVVIALAGPAASAVGAFIAWSLYIQAASHGFWHDLCAILLMGNVGAVVLNLLPLRLTEGRESGSPTFWLDGRVALDAIRGTTPPAN